MGPEQVRFNHLLGLIDRFVKDNEPRGTNLADNDEDSLASASNGELGSQTIVSNRVEGLSLAELRACIEACEEKGGWEPLKRLIEEVLTSLTALAGSFTVSTQQKTADHNPHNEDVEMAVTPTAAAAASQEAGGEGEPVDRKDSSEGTDGERNEEGEL